MNSKALENTRKTTRSGSLKKNSSTPVEAPPARRQNTGDKKTTNTPEKLAASKPKPAAAPETSKPETRESSSKSNNAGAMDFAALLSKQMDEFMNMMISTQQQTLIL
ncbi:hypothetical protein H8356DRAFT_1346279 [Neocallimastix lanati (nom. inval.)]|nr:hypothetical protein H8356DRAFT_1346279 [Neocallimastix sp. JGI-2020a]